MIKVMLEPYTDQAFNIAYPSIISAGQKAGFMM